MSREFDVTIEMVNAKSLNKELNDEIQEKVRQVMSTVANATYSQGVDLVSKKLKSTLLDYLSNFQILAIDNNTRIIQLNPKYSYLEDGYSSYDMKPGLLNGPKAQQSKNGNKYVTVAFAKKTGAAATNLAEQLMAIELKQALKKGTDASGKAADMNKKQPGEGMVGRASSDTQHHSYVQGAVRIQKKYNKTTQSTFIVFRRLSSKTDANKWIHPGFGGVHIFPSMESFAEQELNTLKNP